MSENILKEQTVFRVKVTIDGVVHERRWTIGRIHQALLQWSDPLDPASPQISKIEIEPDEGPSHAAR
jgi:hypothetical protein